MEPVQISDSAVKAIIDKTALNSQAVGVRLKVDSTGCSGHSYVMEHVLKEDLGADDKFEKNGATLYIPKIHSWLSVEKSFKK